MNRWITFVAWLECLLKGGRCRQRSVMDGDRCRKPVGHDGNCVMWHWRLF